MNIVPKCSEIRENTRFLLPQVIQPIGLFKEDFKKYFKNFIKKIGGGGIVLLDINYLNKKGC